MCDGSVVRRPLCTLDEPDCFSWSKLELQIELHAARWLRCNSMTEKCRADDTNIGDVILVIQDVEGVDRNGPNRSFLTPFGKKEVTRKIEIHVDVAGAVKSVPRSTCWTIDRQAVVVVIAACGD